MKFLKPTTKIIIIIFLVSINCFSQLKIDEILYNEIQQKLIQKYDQSVVLENIYQLDSLELYDGYYPLPYKISNPYGTLTNTTIFTAMKQTEYSCKGLVGIYKNGSIIWDSDTVMNCSGDFGNYDILVIFSVSDINRDGKVDILLQSIYQGPTNYSAIQRLYGFSWDGNNGWLITDTDSEGKSTIESLVSFGDFDLVDVNGDGVYEITADWYLNEEDQNYKTLTHYWNGSKYIFDPSKPQPQPYDFLVQNNIDVSLKASVQKVGSVYKYSYILHNLPTSKQEIRYFYLKLNCDTIFYNSKPENWFFGSYGDFHFFGCLEYPDLYYDSVNFIKPNYYETFNINSARLPSIVQFYIQAYNKEPAVYDTIYGITVTLDDVYNNIFINSKFGFTIGPSKAFNSLGNIDIIDSVINYVNQS
ncbi:MAG: hypothetical protein ACUVRG_12010, partial [Ignavibacterium sp.]|uniref:hypothetical protein n=1 Tax=Ignavibacterium sp. TaxID=2651167 RepID=UPI004048F825